jgi:hypothetical protein
MGPGAKRADPAKPLKIISRKRALWIFRVEKCTARRGSVIFKSFKDLPAQIAKPEIAACSEIRHPDRRLEYIESRETSQSPICAIRLMRNARHARGFWPKIPLDKGRKSGYRGAVFQGRIVMERFGNRATPAEIAILIGIIIPCRIEAG